MSPVSYTHLELQAQAILEMRLRALQGMEREKLDAEYKELIKTIAYLTEVLNNEKLVLYIIKDELTQIQEKYGDHRRTIITRDDSELSDEDLIAEEDMVITITNNGYIKRLNTCLLYTSLLFALRFHIQYRRKYGRGYRGRH